MFVKSRSLLHMASSSLFIAGTLLGAGIPKLFILAMVMKGDVSRKPHWISGGLSGKVNKESERWKKTKE